MRLDTKNNYAFVCHLNSAFTVVIRYLKTVSSHDVFE
jgi:hypothetical protein